MDIKELFIKYKNIILQDKKMMIVILIAIIGVFLILFSSNLNKNNSKEIESANIDYEKYIEKTEKKLENILSKIKGVGNCNVMISLLSTDEKEYVVQDKTKSNISEKEDSRQSSEDKESEVVIIKNDTSQTPLIKRNIVPKISGVLVTCDGAYDITTKTNVIDAVCAVLSVSSNNVCVVLNS